jgi:hypothetical protein
MSSYSIVIGRFEFGDSEMFSVIQTNNIEELSPVDRDNPHFGKWVDMVYTTFSKGRLFHDEKNGS